MRSILFKRSLGAVSHARLACSLTLAAAALGACSYVKPMQPALKKAVAARDTIYLLPARSFFATKSFLHNEPDLARMQAIRESTDEILLDEVRRAFPAATVIPVQKGGEDSVLDLAGGATVMDCEVTGFGRTLGRKIVGETLNVIFMVPTFGMNLGFPLQASSNVFLRIRKPGAVRVVKLKHRDMVDPSDREELRFQIRILLDPAYRA